MALKQLCVQAKTVGEAVNASRCVMDERCSTHTHTRTQTHTHTRAHTHTYTHTVSLILHGTCRSAINQLKAGIEQQRRDAAVAQVRPCNWGLVQRKRLPPTL